MDNKIKIGQIELDDRIIYPPIYSATGDVSGKATDKMCEFYALRAANPNVSLVITEHSYIAKNGKARIDQLSLADDCDFDSLRRLVDTIHENGARTICQLNHGGAACEEAITGFQPIAPSAVLHTAFPPQPNREMPREMTRDDIDYIVYCFAAAAARAKAAGYDGVEIHTAHGYLLNEFYSPMSNKRSDEYGGSLENRLRIHRDVIRAVRAAVGSDYTVAIRVGAADYAEGGNTAEDGAAAAKIFAEEGVDIIDVSGGMCRYNRPDCKDPGYFQELSRAIKAVVDLPVILTGGVKTVEQARALIADGAADLIGVGRSLLKDPYWGM